MLSQFDEDAVLQDGRLKVSGTTGWLDGDDAATFFVHWAVTQGDASVQGLTRPGADPQRWASSAGATGFVPGPALAVAVAVVFRPAAAGFQTFYWADTVGVVAAASALPTPARTPLAAVA